MTKPVSFEVLTQVTSQSFVVPAGVTRLLVEGCGGGGGGGGGAGGAGFTGGCGGSGGGGSITSARWMRVVPGETLTYSTGTAGTAGAAGASSSSGGDGGDGGDTTVSGSLQAITFRGAGRGGGGWDPDVIATKAFVRGGSPSRTAGGHNYGTHASVDIHNLQGSPGQGGSAWVWAHQQFDGGGSPTVFFPIATVRAGAPHGVGGHTPASGGTAGADFSGVIGFPGSTYYAYGNGTAGGGGGSSSWGTGAPGGTGGSQGTAGSSPTAPGAGGGGGGGGALGFFLSGDLGRNGGLGVAGAIRFTWFV